MKESAKVRVKATLNEEIISEMSILEGVSSDTDFMNKVLIIDDELMNSEVLTSLLQVENVSAET